jgi:purine-nucleoside phosphorylase
VEGNGQKSGIDYTLDDGCSVCETPEAIEAARSKGVLAVEMEAAALYAFARAAGVAMLCLADAPRVLEAIIGMGTSASLRQF